MIRKASYDDLNDILAIERECFSVPWSEDGFIAELESRDAVFLVDTENGHVAGFSIMHGILNEGEIYNIAVRGKYRRLGKGRALLEETIRRSRERGIESLWLEVRRSNIPAQSLYRSLGFEICGERKNYYDAPMEDAILMDAKLDTMEDSE